MRRLNLTLHSRLTFTQLFPWLLIAVLVGLLLFDLYRWLGLMDQVGAAAARLSRAERMVSPIPAPVSGSTGQEQEQYTRLKAVIERLSHDPLPPIDALSNRMPADIAVLAIESGDSDSSFTLTVEAKDRTTLYHFWSVLQQAPEFASVTLVERASRSGPQYSIERGVFRLTPRT